MKNVERRDGRFDNLLSFRKMPPPHPTGNKRPTPLIHDFHLCVNRECQESFLSKAYRDHLVVVAAVVVVVPVVVAAVHFSLHN